MRITVLVIVNIDGVTLNYEFVIEINGLSFEHWNDVIRIRLKRTIWSSSGEPTFESSINVARLRRRLLQWVRKKLRSRE